MQDIYYPEKDLISLIVKETFFGFTLAPKKYQLYMLLRIKDILKGSHYSTEIKIILSVHFHEELIFGIQQSHVDQKIATML